MKKICAILAATVALGSAIFATPAQAEQKEVAVKVSVQPTLILQAFDTIDLTISAAELGATNTVISNPGNPTTNGTTKLTIDPPPALTTTTAEAVTKSGIELFAVWGNTDKTVNVTVTPVTDTLVHKTISTKKIKITGITVNNGSGTVSEDVPLVGGVDLTFNVKGAAAGIYEGGKIKVEALAQL